MRMPNEAIARDSLFISKATPADDAFVLWLAPRLEAAGYRVFADILRLDGGDVWRPKLTLALRQGAARMLLCCTDDTLARRGVIEEIGIGEEVARELGITDFILPLRLQPFRKVFGIGELQYIDFVDGWASGLSRLLETLQKKGVPKASGGVVQPAWAVYLRRMAVRIEAVPEPLTSSWLRVLHMPDRINFVRPLGATTEAQRFATVQTVSLPLVAFGDGFWTFGNGTDLQNAFPAAGRCEVHSSVSYDGFLEQGCQKLGITPRDAGNLINSLLRQAWEKNCLRRGLTPHSYASDVGFHVGENLLPVGKRVGWGRQGSRRNSVLRNRAKGRLWEFGVSATASRFPFPHYRLKGRVRFSERDVRTGPEMVIEGWRQGKVRRSTCSGWRNKAWHGRLMAFMEVLAGESPYVDLPVGAGLSITLDGMPIQCTAPVTARQTFVMDEDAEEADPTTIQGYQEFDE